MKPSKVTERKAIKIKRPNSSNIKGLVKRSMPLTTPKATIKKENATTAAMHENRVAGSCRMLPKLATATSFSRCGATEPEANSKK